MSHFYGTLSGQARTSATRRGSKKSGIDTVAASWQGAVYVFLRHNEKTGHDEYTIRLSPWQGQGQSKLIAKGVFKA